MKLHKIIKVNILEKSLCGQWQFEIVYSQITADALYHIVIHWQAGWLADLAVCLVVTYSAKSELTKCLYTLYSPCFFPTGVKSSNKCQVCHFSWQLHYTCPSYNRTSTMFNRWGGALGYGLLLFFLHTLTFSLFWQKLIFVSSVHRTLYPQQYSWHAVQ